MAEKMPPTGPPIHPLSAIALIVIDSLWLLADWDALLWIITIPVSFVSCFVPVFLLQKFMRGDGNGQAAAIATLLAILAAVPTPISGTIVGTIVLSWAGLHSLGKQPKVVHDDTKPQPPRLNEPPPP